MTQMKKHDEPMTGCQSGYGTDCNSVNDGSIPSPVSKPRVIAKTIFHYNRKSIDAFRTFLEGFCDDYDDLHRQNGQLLEALELIDRTIGGGESDPDVMAEMLNEIAKIVPKAIAKARGQS